MNPRNLCQQRTVRTTPWWRQNMYGLTVLHPENDVSLYDRDCTVSYSKNLDFCAAMFLENRANDIVLNNIVLGIAPNSTTLFLYSNMVLGIMPSSTALSFLVVRSLFNAGNTLKYVPLLTVIQCFSCQENLSLSEWESLSYNWSFSQW